MHVHVPLPGNHIFLYKGGLSTREFVDLLPECQWFSGFLQVRLPRLQKSVNLYMDVIKQNSTVYKCILYLYKIIYGGGFHQYIF